MPQLTGKLHVILDGGRLATVNARAGLLTSASSVECTTYGIVPFDLNIEVQKFIVNRTETIGVVAGKTLGDADTLVVRVLYLGKRDVANHEVPSLDLDSSLFGSYPGLEVLDVHFHPDSEQHVVILTSDRTLRVYNVEEARCGLPAEQTFELRGRRRVFLHEEDDDDDENGMDGLLRDPVPVSFDFGGNSGGARDVGKMVSSSSASLTSSIQWSRLAILVLMSDGEIRPLCPVSPFGARYSGRFVAGLLAGVGSDGGSDLSLSGVRSQEELAQIWTFKAFGVDDWRNVDQQRKYVVAPHALESHVARFPDRGLRIRSNGAGDDAALSSSKFCSVHTWPMSPSVHGILATSSGGRMRAGVLLGDVLPAWTTSPPQCVFHGEEIVAVRSQCVQQKIFPTSDRVNLGRSGPSHVIIDDIVLEDQPIDAVFRDPANPTSFVVAQQLCAHVVSIPWISTLEGIRMEGRVELPDVLMPPSATDLARFDRATPAVCHALLGDKLSGSFLFTILSDGTQTMKRIVSRIDGICGFGRETAGGIAGVAGIKPGNGADERQMNSEGRQEALVSHVKAMYAPITSVPAIAARSFSLTEFAVSPSNVEAFVESVSDLRSHHVSFCHKASHTIRQRVDQLEDEVKDQLGQVEEITKLLHQVEKRQSDLENLQGKTQWMSANVADRVQLLGELYWAVPQPKSEEEKRFQHHELPMLESSTAALATEVSLLRSMATKIKERGATTGTAVNARDGVRASDLRHLREKLEEHQESICGLGLRLREVEKAL
jgi:hypothetical protein